MRSLLSFAKKRWTYIVLVIIALFIGGAFGPSQEELDQVLSAKQDMEITLSKEKEKNDKLSDTNKELAAKVEEAEPYFKMEEEERKNKQAEAEAKAAELEKKKAAAEAEAEAKEKKKAVELKKKAEEKEKKGYETGITYNQLARTPDDYMGEKIKFRGKVIQVMEGDDTTQIRLAVGEDYDTILFGEYDSSIVNSRILEDDIITVMGLSTGLLTYESTMGGDISIPGMSIDKIQ